MKIVYRNAIYESINTNNVLISVDIQPEYENYMRFKPYSFMSWLETNSEKYSKIVFLFNGPELGFPSENEYKMWLLENEMSEDLLEQIDFFDKGYAFFRNAMDAGLDEGEILKLINYMYKNNINDSREIEDEVWSQIGLDASTIEHMNKNEDALFIPDVMNYLSKITGNISLVGGGKNECLREVEFCLKVLNKPYTLINEWVY
jgi:hypothetical protein